MTNPTHYLYKIQPTRPEMLSEGATAEEEEIVSRHFAYLESLTRQGVVFLAGRTLNTDKSSFGIVILKVDSEAAARQVMTNDPAVKNRIMRAELYPYRLTLLADR